MTELDRIDGEPGNFTVHLRRQLRHKDVNECVVRGRLPGAFSPETKDAFDKDCRKEVSIKVGAIILSPGYRACDPSGLAEWGYGRFPNVITATELEQRLAMAGPACGRLLRPSDGKPVMKMAFLQCIGSRDRHEHCRDYCSDVCCMHAIKHAMIAMDRNRSLSVTIFHMDVRTHGKHFERLFHRAKGFGIGFQRCRVRSIEPCESEDFLGLRFVAEDGAHAYEEFDLVVLSVGIEPPVEAASLAERTGIELTPEGFAETSCFMPVSTSRPGIFACGRFLGPMDIYLSTTGGSAAATAAGILLTDQRYAMSRQMLLPVERDVSAEGPRIGVFVCDCGSNISDLVDLNEVVYDAQSLANVVLVEKTPFACSPDSQQLIRSRIAETNLNRVVVAACTPLTHEALFRETLRASGLNGWLLEMANIRNQVAWVHDEQPEHAVSKAKDMVRMAVAKAALLEPLPAVSVPVIPRALVIGGGLAGMTAALALADQGFPVDLVERDARLGGTARHLFKTWKGENVAFHLEMLASRVMEHNLITVHHNSTVIAAEGHIGSFRSTIHKQTGNISVEHGVTILATGGQPYKTAEYGYGNSEKIFTSLEFDGLHAAGDDRIRKGRNFVFIQCVGSREPGRNYCSRVCCTHSIRSAVSLMQEDPARRVFILHKDIRTYGLRENLYRRARELGVIFINYSERSKPSVVINKDGIEVIAWDHVLNESFSFPADVITLAAAIVPNAGAREIAELYNVPVDKDGFLREGPAKLRPVEFAPDGVFLAGLAHYPKPIEESTAQAQAAVSSAVRVLSTRWFTFDQAIARVDELKCDLCGVCIGVCPYKALAVKPGDSADKAETRKLKLFVQPAKCKGCGACQAACPREGISIMGFSNGQIIAQVIAALHSKVK